MSAPMDPMLPAPTAVDVMQTLLRAIDACAENAATDNSGAEAKDYAGAVKDLADAYVVLDPALDGTGVPLEHQVELEQMRQEHDERQNDRQQEAVHRQDAAANQRRAKRS